MTCLTYFEPLEAGHCAFWAEMVLQAAARDERISRLRLVTSPTLATRLDTTVRSTRLELVQIRQSDLAELRKDNLLQRGKAQWNTARNLLAVTGGHLFLPFLDHAIYGAILDRSKVNGRVSGIIFRPPNGYNLPTSSRRSLDVARRWGSYLAARRPALHRLFTLDEYCANSLISRAAGILTFLPDPTPDLSLLHHRTRQPREDGRRVLLLFGALAARKGIFAALEALKHLSPEANSKTVLRFVGKVVPPDRDAFKAKIAEVRSLCPNAKIELVDAFVSNDILAQEVVDCDVVLAPYQNHVGSSGVIFWAVAAAKPLIAQSTGLMGYQLDHYGLGMPVDTHDSKSLAAAFANVDTFSRNTAFLASHSPKAFTNTILNGCLT